MFLLLLFVSKYYLEFFGFKHVVEREKDIVFFSESNEEEVGENGEETEECIVEDGGEVVGVGLEEE